MTRAPSFCGIILATGIHARLERDRATLPWPPPSAGAQTGTTTILSAYIDLLKRHTDLVIVVAGNNSEQIAPIVYTNAAFLIVNTAPELGDFNSLKLGLREVLNHGRDAAFIALADRPPVTEATVARLHSEFLAAIDSDQWAAVPQFEDQNGYPCVVGREMIEALLRAQLTATAMDVMLANAARIRRVPVEDRFVTAGIDTLEDYQRLAATLPAQEIKY